MITRIRAALTERRESRRMADEYRVIGALLAAEEELTGIDFMRRTRLSSGRLYPALARLERRRLITPTWRGERVYYGLAASRIGQMEGEDVSTPRDNVKVHAHQDDQKVTISLEGLPGSRKAVAALDTDRAMELSNLLQEAVYVIVQRKKRGSGE